MVPLCLVQKKLGVERAGVRAEEIRLPVLEESFGPGRGLGSRTGQEALGWTLVHGFGVACILTVMISEQPLFPIIIHPDTER